MRVPAVALGVNQSTASAVVFGSGALGCSVAGLLSLVGHQVKLLGSGGAVPTECDVWTQSRVHYTSKINISTADDHCPVQSNDIVIVAVPATEYGAVAEDLAQHLSSGQTIFILGAAIGASLQISSIIERTRRDLSINIVEVGQPFSRYELDGKTVRISGLKDRLIIAGRSLNETRAGLSVGSTLLNGLVPASNIIDRAFADMPRWLETAAILFNSFDRSSSPSDSVDCSPNDNANVVVAALRSEIEALAKAYGVKNIDRTTVIDARAVTTADWRNDLAQRVIEDYIILSSLARLTYMPVPLIETVIELASVVTSVDLRKEARQLEDLGIIGMDAKEIIEHVN